MVIQLQRDQFERASEFIRNSAIGNVRLVSAAVSANFEAEGLQGALQTEISFAPAEVARRAGSVSLNTQFAFKIFQERSELDREDLISIECKFGADYSLRPGYEASEDAICAFHSANAIFNVWPFFREYVQTTAARMTFPPPPVPFLTFAQAESSADPSRSGEQSRLAEEHAPATQASDKSFDEVQHSAKIEVLSHPKRRRSRRTG